MSSCPPPPPVAPPQQAERRPRGRPPKAKNKPHEAAGNDSAAVGATASSAVEHKAEGVPGAPAAGQDVPVKPVAPAVEDEFCREGDVDKGMHGDKAGDKTAEAVGDADKSGGHSVAAGADKETEATEEAEGEKPRQDPAAAQACHSAAPSFADFGEALGVQQLIPVPQEQLSAFEPWRSGAAAAASGVSAATATAGNNAASAMPSDEPVFLVVSEAEMQQISRNLNIKREDVEGATIKLESDGPIFALAAPHFQATPGRSGGRKPRGGPPKPPAILTCSECGYSTDRRNNLNRHTTTMHGRMKEGARECCGEIFYTKAEHKRHCLAAHKNGFTFTCPFDDCGKTFSRRPMLVRHMDVHTGRRDLRCPRSGCDYATSHRSNLRRHEYTHLRQCMHGPGCLTAKGDKLAKGGADEQDLSPAVRAAIAANAGCGGGDATLYAVSGVDGCKQEIKIETEEEANVDRERLLQEAWARKREQERLRSAAEALANIKGTSATAGGAAAADENNNKEKEGDGKAVVKSEVEDPLAGQGVSMSRPQQPSPSMPENSAATPSQKGNKSKKGVMHWHHHRHPYLQQQQSSSSDCCPCRRCYCACHHKQGQHLQQQQHQGNSNNFSNQHQPCGQGGQHHYHPYCQRAASGEGGRGDCFCCCCLRRRAAAAYAGGIQQHQLNNYNRYYYPSEYLFGLEQFASAAASGSAAHGAYLAITDQQQRQRATSYSAVASAATATSTVTSSSAISSSASAAAAAAAHGTEATSTAAAAASTPYPLQYHPEPVMYVYEQDQMGQQVSYRCLDSQPKKASNPLSAHGNAGAHRPSSASATSTAAAASVTSSSSSSLPAPQLPPEMGELLAIMGDSGASAEGTSAREGEGGGSN